MALDRFFISEEERKMREAALRLDFELAITHRDAMKELEAKWHEAEEKKRKAAPPKVVHIFKKTAFEPPESDEAVATEEVEPGDLEIVEAQPDEDVLALLEELTEQARQCKIVALGVLIGTDHHTTHNYFTDKVLDNVVLFVGAAHTFAADIIAIEADMMDDTEEGE